MMTEKWRQAFEDNYQIYLKRQGDLINTCFASLDTNSNEHDVENAIRHLEQMFWRSTTAKKVYWTAAHHLHIYSFWEFYNLQDIPQEEFNDRHSWKYTFSKKNYDSHKHIFDERDKKVLERLQLLWSKFYMPIEQVMQQKEYFPNMVSAYTEALKNQD